MIFELEDGREHLYQWDSQRRLIINDPTINQIHYCNRTDECSLVCEVYEEDGVRYADVPNILLQTDWRINVYAYDKSYTKHSAVFTVVKRSKPADYVYTETEALNYDTLLERMNAIDENIATEVNEYLKENPVEVDLTNYYTKEETDYKFTGYFDKDETLQMITELAGSTVEYVDEAIANIDVPTEVYTGSETPTDENVKIWVDPNEQLNFATTDYVDNAIANIDIPEGEIVDEVFVGTPEPTDENVKIWVNPEEQLDFATIDYVDNAIANIDIPEGEIVDEVYVGNKTPTDENVKIWVNPDEQLNFATTEYVDNATSGFTTEERVNELISTALGVIENGTY